MATAKFPVVKVFEAALRVRVDIEDSRQKEVDELVEDWYKAKPTFFERLFKATDRRSVSKEGVIQILKHKEQGDYWGGPLWSARNRYSRQYDAAQRIVDMCDAAIRHGVAEVELTEADIDTLGGSL